MGCHRPGWLDEGAAPPEKKRRRRRAQRDGTTTATGDSREGTALDPADAVTPEGAGFRWGVGCGVAVSDFGSTMDSSDSAVPERQSTGPPPTACHVSPTTWMSRTG